MSVAPSDTPQAPSGRGGPGPRPEPTFGELLRSNLKLAVWVLAGVALAWLVWRGLVWLFPDVAWLRPRAGY